MWRSHLPLTDSGHMLSIENPFANDFDRLMVFEELVHGTGIDP